MEAIKIALALDIEASPEQVFDALTTEIGMWWSHSFMESPAAIRLEPTVGGRFYEDFDGAGNGALFATVTYIQRPKELHLSGPMGMHAAVSALIIIKLEPTAAGTRLSLTHDAVGNVTTEHQEGYAAGWQMLLSEKLVTHLSSKG